MSEKKPFELKKMWQWLAYLYVVLPALLFLLGFLTRNMDMGILFARLFHSYCLYSRCAVHDRHSRGSIGTGCGLLHPVPPGFPGLRCELRTHSAEFSLLFHPDKLSADPLSAVYVNLAFHTPVSGFLPEPAYFTW